MNRADELVQPFRCPLAKCCNCDVPIAPWKKYKQLEFSGVHDAHNYDKIQSASPKRSQVPAKSLSSTILLFVFPTSLQNVWSYIIFNFKSREAHEAHSNQILFSPENADYSANVHTWNCFVITWTVGKEWCAIRA